MNEQIIIVELKVFEKGSLKAFADVTITSLIGEITVKGFRVIQKDGEAPWIGFPSNSYIKNGKTVNNQIIETSKSLKRKLTDLILAEYKRATETTPF